ncbi:hypothetical protein [Pseudomonas sp. F01002]|uniref:hypothetical protein n=1 Tax=Pseudomonas sp. F01002 TaxID=2555724 RepID=UPI00106BB579|nr:hypothetical protein [Pseudomonas sp. F01002]TFB39017.1 hypothetical protein E3W21_17700 [Pseudomonas sp. F01002]
MSGLPLGIVELTSNVAGAELKFPVSLVLDVSSREDAVNVSVSAVINMASLQDNFDAIVKSFPMPNDTSGYGNKFIATVNGASLSPSGDGATLNADINVVGWHIEKGLPGAGATVQYKEVCVDIPFIGRKCVMVPDGVEIKPGDDIKLRLFGEDVACRIDFSLVTPDGNSLELRPTSVDVTPHGDIGKFFNDVAGIFNTNLNDVVRREISEIISDGTLRKALPLEFQSFNPKITTAHFAISENGKLQSIIMFNAQITGEQLTEWLAQSIN